MEASKLLKHIEASTDRICKVFKVSKVIKARYEKGVLKLLEPVQLREGEEVLVRIERLKDRRRIVDEFYGKRGSASKELLDEFMLEAEAQ